MPNPALWNEREFRMSLGRQADLARFGDGGSEALRLLWEEADE
jgi:hypothetical protein